MSRTMSVLLALAAWIACDPGPQRTELRSALLVTLDTTRADAIGAYGGPPGLTPALDRLAREGVVYEWARTTSPVTLPAHASMLTGLYPPRHGLRTNGVGALSGTAVTLAELASARSFDTAAFVAAVVLDTSFGLDQGFELYDAPVRRPTREASFSERRAGEVASRVIEWLRSAQRYRPFFLWVHFFDPHEPYDPRDRRLRQRARENAYWGEVAVVDDALARILRTLRRVRLLDETLVVVVGDHGEGLGEHGEDTHGSLVYDATLRVPLIVRYPDGFRAGERSPEIVSVVDVFPTLVEALRLGDPGAVDGVSLYRRRAPDARGVYFESFYGAVHYGWAPLVGWVDRTGKYVHGPHPELFDPVRDPGEVRNLAGPESGAAYRERIERIARAPALAPGPQVEPAVLRELAALGYAIAGSGSAAPLPDPFAPDPLPDPREHQAEIAQLREGSILLAEEEPRAAVAALKSLLSENPRNRMAQDMLGTALSKAGRCPEAIRTLQALIDDGFGSLSSYTTLGGCLLHLGRPEEALDPLLRAHEIGPTEPMPLVGLERAAKQLGRDAEAAGYRRRLETLRR